MREAQLSVRVPVAGPVRSLLWSGMSSAGKSEQGQSQSRSPCVVSEELLRNPGASAPLPPTLLTPVLWRLPVHRGGTSPRP